MITGAGVMNAALAPARKKVAAPIDLSNTVKGQGLGVLPGMPGSAQQTLVQPAKPAALPTNPVDQQNIINAQTAYGDTTSSLHNGIQQAALAYGDPTAMAAYGLQGTPNPVGALQLAAQKAQNTSNSDEARRMGSGTTLSSLAGRDSSLIAQNQQNADEMAKQRFDAAVTKYNTNMVGAKDAEDSTVGSATASEAQQGINAIPQYKPTTIKLNTTPRKGM